MNTLNTSARDAVKPALRERAVAALKRTWDVIALDILNCQDAFDGAGEGTVSGEEAAECALDHLEMYGGDKDALRWFYGQEQAVKDAVVKQAFPFKRYGR